MRATPIPDDEAGAIPGERTVIAPPGGNFLDPDISACEAMIDTVWDGGEIATRTFSMRIALDPGDLDRLIRGDAFWLTVTSLRLAPFSLGFIHAQVPADRCKNCQGELTFSDDGEFAFHRYPEAAVRAGCGTPEVEWVEKDPPRKPVILTEAQEEAMDVLLHHALARGTQDEVDAAMLFTEKDGHP